MENHTESDYRLYFRNMLLNFLETRPDIKLPERFITVRSHCATKIYLTSIENGDLPPVALDKAQHVLLKGFRRQ